MHLIRIGKDRLVNLDLVADVQWHTPSLPDAGRKLWLTLAVPAYTYQDEDEWGTDARQVVMDDGEEAQALWAYLCDLATIDPSAV